MEHIVTKENIEAYCAALHAAERAGSTIVKYRRELNQLAIWLAGRPASQERLAAWKAALAAQGYAPCTINAMLAAANGFFWVYGLGDSSKALKDTAAAVSRYRQRTKPRGVRTAADRSQRRRAGEAGAHHGNTVRDRHPHQRAAVYDHRGGADRSGDHRTQGEDTDDPAQHKALPQAAAIREEAGNDERRDLLYEKRTRHLQKTGLAGAETAVQASRRRSQQGVSAQLPQAVCDDIL